MNTRALSFTLLLFSLGSTGCMLGPEHGDWIDSILDDVTFNVMSPWEDANYVIHTAEFNANDEVVAWHFLTTGQTDLHLLTDVDGRDLYIDAVTTPILIGWTDAPGPGCGGINPNCHKKVRIRTRVQGPNGTWYPAYTYDDGTVSCRNNALIEGGADKVITDCARSEDWVEVFAYDN